MNNQKTPSYRFIQKVGKSVAPCKCDSGRYEICSKVIVYDKSNEQSLTADGHLCTCPDMEYIFSSDISDCDICPHYQPNKEYIPYPETAFETYEERYL